MRNPFLLACNHDALVSLVGCLDIGDQVDLFTLNQVLDAPAELSTCGQGIALPTAKELVDRLPADGPHDLGREDLFSSIGGLYPQDEGCLLSAWRFHFVQASPCHTEYTRLQRKM